MTIKNMTDEKRFKKTIVKLGEGTGETLYRWSDGTYHKTKEQ